MGQLVAIQTQKEAEDMIYRSYLRAVDHITEKLDERVRRPELTRKLLEMVGAPDQGQKFILVTGSKGKGSTSRLISSLLSHMGYKVGLFTSPHLFHFNERIRVDGKAITEDDFIRLSNKIQPAFEKIEAELPPYDYQGPIGVALTVAVLYFQEKRTDFNVIECGRGGTYDDTNVLSNNWAVITPILEEHVHNIGPTLTDITKHKFGIVKEETSHIYIGEQRDRVKDQLKALLKASGKVASFYGDQFSAHNRMISSRGTEFSVQTTQGCYENLKLLILGEFQAVNASLALQLCSEIKGEKLDEKTVCQCFSNLQWPGRCEIINEQPTIIVDGAIHRDSAKFLKNIIQAINKSGDKKITSIISVPEDKDYDGVIQVMSSVSDQLIVTKPDISHLKFPDEAVEVANKYKAGSQEFENLGEAVRQAIQDNPSGVILIVGTQTLIGNAKRLFGQSLFDIGK